MKKIVVDCDNTLGLPGKEIDDGLALLYLLGQPSVELLGVTTTFGNGRVEQVSSQTRWLLNKIGRYDVPIREGASHYGDRNTEAAHFLAKVVRENPNEIILFGLGPLTNLWAASQIYSEFMSSIKHIYCMGGMRQSVRVGWRRLKELNFSADPTAASAVLNASCPVNISHTHTCLPMSFHWKHFCELGSLPFWLAVIIWQWLIAFGIYSGVGKFYMWDLLPCLMQLRPSLFEFKAVMMDLDIANLRRGRLAESERDGTIIHVASRILDEGKCRDAIFNGWLSALS